MAKENYVIFMYGFIDIVWFYRYSQSSGKVMNVF